MTNDFEAVTIEQVDRDAAAAFIKSDACPLGAKMILGFDIKPLAEVFARHRLAERERCARVADDAAPATQDCLSDAIRETYAPTSPPPSGTPTM